MKKKKVISVLIIIIFIAGFLCYQVDRNRVEQNKRPIFTIKISSQDGNTVHYIGLGYRVLAYPGVSPKEPFENNLDRKIGLWLMKDE